METKTTEIKEFSPDFEYLSEDTSIIETTKKMKEEKEKKINGILSLNQLEEIKSNLIPTDLIPKNILQETLKTLKPKIEEIIINNLGIEGLNYFNYIIINPTFSEEGICTFEIDCSVAALKMLENQENNIKR